jgi:hypothetical protein
MPLDVEYSVAMKRALHIQALFAVVGGFVPSNYDVHIIGCVEKREVFSSISNKKIKENLETK